MDEETNLLTAEVEEPEEIETDTEVELDEEQPNEVDAEEDEEGGEDDGSEEIDLGDGKKYRVPKEIKDSIMLHKDYTQKTQAIASERKSIEAQAQLLQVERESFSRQREGFSKIAALDAAIEEFKEMDWDALAESDPATAQKYFMQLQRAKEAKAQIEREIAEDYRKSSEEKQRSAAKLREEGEKVLRREIPNWSNTVAMQVREFAISQGFSEREIDSVLDPKVVKILHSAMVGEKVMKKSVAKPSAATAKPTKTVGGASKTTVNPDKASMDDWLKMRNAELAKKNKR